eukprot:scaffold10515_cov17-Tisochrysis_lutea.AAC.1
MKPGEIRQLSSINSTDLALCSHTGQNELHLCHLHLQAWDSGIGSAPALIDLLSSGKCDVKDKSVLIPGCGRGYDNATFIRAGAKEAVGLEVAPAAKAAAEEYLKVIKLGGKGNLNFKVRALSTN